jgi:TP901 family phage tail tape measure protein
MTFDKSMSAVRAVSGATATDMGKLRQAALDAGEATVFSATESAQAEAELARAGISTADILGGAPRGSLDLAAAGQLGLADAATISAQAMNVFKLRGGDVSHIADVLAAGANKSAADVGQLGDAPERSGRCADRARPRGHRRRP